MPPVKPNSLSSHLPLKLWLVMEDPSALGPGQASTSLEQRGHLLRLFRRKALHEGRESRQRFALISTITLVLGAPFLPEPDVESWCAEAREQIIVVLKPVESKLSL